MKFISSCRSLCLLTAFAACPTFGQDGSPSTSSQAHGLPHSTASNAETATVSSQARFPAAPSQTQGVNPAALERLSDLVNGFVEADEIVGAELLVIKNRRTILHEVFGTDDRAENQRMRRDTIFSIRSMTKPLTGAMAQILVDEGVLQLSEQVAKYIPAFDTDASRGITIEHLVTHRSGLPMRSPGPLWSNYASYNNIREIADYWGNYGPRLFKPGEQYHYADANVDTLAAVIQQAAGQPTESLIQRRLLEPLGMHDTIPLLRQGDERVNRVAMKYAGGRGRWRPFWKWNGKPYFSFPMFAQGFYSTASDYACFLAMLADGGMVAEQRLLSQAAVERILTPVSQTTMPTGFARLESSYGQLMHLYDQKGQVTVFGHSGSDGTYAWVWPQQDLLILYFTQSRGSTTMTRMEAVVDSLLGRPIDSVSGQ